MLLEDVQGNVGDVQSSVPQSYGHDDGKKGEARVRDPWISVHLQTTEARVEC